MKDTYASVRLAQKPENAFACHRCGRVILIAEFLEAKNIQLNCNRCGFKKHVEKIKIEKKSEIKKTRIAAISSKNSSKK
ncbi:MULTISPECIES: hypothetical protein [Spiroplasma]|uniref:Com family DNA-binding transcriptional regulator n=1 Tax=Spiroplasma ixodetis TaxID=2141 RepID=A0ABM8BWI3_9MOLU|nr:hypothetical protein [Spiroplasma ixodetis]BDT04207.1 hypothetical protein SHM_18530 [Spiroplasma ixodetis]